VTPEPVSGYTVTEHAFWEMSRRNLSEDQIRKVLANPGQREKVREGRDVLQAKFFENGQEYLIRVFVDVDRKPPEIVTAYRTSKVSKYWSEEK
jgi:hypothetical protein